MKHHSFGIFALAFMLACGAWIVQAFTGWQMRAGFVYGLNSFSKEEIVAFETLLAGFEDALVLSNAVGKYETDPTTMERAKDIIWRPNPYIGQTFSGMDQTANFTNYTQLAVPAFINIQRSAPWTMGALELRDALQQGRLLAAARQRLSSDINVNLSNVAALQGTLFVKRTTAAVGFDDAAQCDAIMTEQGVMMNDRFLAFAPRDYNNAASNLASRGTVAGKVQTAYEKAYVGEISNFETLKLDYAYRLAAAAGVTVTMNGANQFYTPVAGTVDTNGGQVNTDNRYQTVTIGVASGTVKVGDAFTIAGVNAVHHITKQDTGQLKTFRVQAIVTGGGGAGTIQISPPIISGQGATAAELQYQNVTATPANGAAITFLNTVAGTVSPFWYREAMEMIPGTIAFTGDAGVQLIEGTTEQGFTLYMQKFADINTGNVKFRVDTRFGICVKQPEMMGAMMFSQT